jgi:hypothetical protein
MHPFVYSAAEDVGAHNNLVSFSEIALRKDELLRTRPTS